MPGRSVRRPHADTDDAGQPVAALAVLARIRPHVRGAPHRTCRHQTGVRDMRNDPRRASEDWRPRHDQRPACKARVRVDLHGIERVRNRRAPITHLRPSRRTGAG